MNLVLRLLLVVLATVCLGGRAEASQPPGALVSSLTEQVLAESAAMGPAVDPVRVKAFIESTLMPNLDFRTMTARAVGPRWRGATDDQKARLMAAFEALLIKTYASAFEQAAGATYRLKQTIALDANTAEVRSEVVARGAHEPIELNYRLALHDDAWKIIDVSVLGVWLVPTYQTQFAQIIERSGLDGLVQAMQDKAR